MSDPNQEDDWRQLGMEIIVTLAEEASAMFRKHCAGYLPVRDVADVARVVQTRLGGVAGFRGFPQCICLLSVTGITYLVCTTAR